LVVVLSKVVQYTKNFIHIFQQSYGRLRIGVTGRPLFDFECAFARDLPRVWYGFEDLLLNLQERP